MRPHMMPRSSVCDTIMTHAYVLCDDSGMSRGGSVGVDGLPFLSAGAPLKSRCLTLKCDITVYCSNVWWNCCRGGILGKDICLMGTHSGPTVHKDMHTKLSQVKVCASNVPWCTVYNVQRFHCMELIARWRQQVCIGGFWVLILHVAGSANVYSTVLLINSLPAYSVDLMYACMPQMRLPLKFTPWCANDYIIISS